jgi:uncharacterized RDD family membrane protein YckC
MTDPAGSAPTPPSPGNWQTPPPPAPGGFQPNLQQSQVEPGPAPGVSYADLVTRIIALVIDGVILWVINVILLVIAGTIAVAMGAGLLITLVFGVVWAFVTLVYYVYGWTKMRASFGQKFLHLETVNAADGATLTQEQAVRRWAFLWGPFALGAIIPIVGLVISMLAVLYSLYLLYTASQSPKRQGFHDLQAGTVVVKHG